MTNDINFHVKLVLYFDLRYNIKKNLLYTNS